KHCFVVLQQQLRLLTENHPQTKDWTIIFEYELPRERGRRPDVIILAGDTILVLEFKDYATVLQAHIDQVAAYVRDLQHYHAASHHRHLVPILVLTQLIAPIEQQE